MFLIRVDGNQNIGLGHVMRCLSIADALNKLGKKPVFVTADKLPETLIKSRGYEFLTLNTDYRQMETELPIFTQLLSRLTIDGKRVSILVDSYYATAQYLSELKNMGRVIYLDDLCTQIYPADMVINYNCYADSAWYEKNYQDSQWGIPDFLLGSQYAPLRSQFSNVTYQYENPATKVLISTGGSDNYNIAGRLLQHFIQSRNEAFSGLEYLVISGAMNEHYQELQLLAQQYDRIHLYSNVTDMAALMKMSHIGISAAGSTIYELAAVGVPMICFAFADNQLQLMKALEEKEAALCVGDYRQEDELIFEKIEAALLTYLTSYEKRCHHGKIAHEMSDGQGAIRLAQAVLEKH